MSCHISAAIKVFDQEAFHHVDKLATGIAFDVHNEYLYLCGLHHATLLNLRPERVQHEFVSTTLTYDQRRRITWNLTNWTPLCSSCELLQNTLARALESWGARLDIVAYREVVVHFLGGEAAVAKEVEVWSRHGMLGQQKMYLLSPEIGFWITAAGACLGPALDHQRRFLQHTSLRAIQWVNLDGQTVTFHTINR